MKDNFERRFASFNVARSREPPSSITYGKSQQRISRLIFNLGTQSIEEKKFVFTFRTHIRDELAPPGPTWPDPVRPNPTMTLFGGLFLKCVKRYEIEMFPYRSYWPWHYRIKF